MVHCYFFTVDNISNQNEYISIEILQLKIRLTATSPVTAKAVTDDRTDE